MKGIVLAAGRGSRMLGLTDGQPKCRARLKGRALIEWQLEALRAGGVDELAIVTGYRAETFTFPVTYFNNPRWAETQMVRSLETAAPWLTTSTCVVSYSDIVYPASAVRALRAAAGDIVIAFDPEWLRLWSMRFADPLADAETFRLEGSRVVEIGGRAGSVDDIKGQYMGLFRLTPDGWATIARHLSSMPAAAADRLDVTSLLRQLIGNGVVINAVPIDDHWYEVDSEADLQCYEALPRLWRGESLS